MTGRPYQGVSAEHRSRPVRHREAIEWLTSAAGTQLIPGRKKPMSESDPAATLRPIARGDYRAPCRHVVVGLGVADALNETSRTTAGQSEDGRTHPNRRGHVQLLLSGSGIFECRGMFLDGSLDERST